MTPALLLLAAAQAAPLSAPFGSSDYGHYYPTAYYDHSGVDWACGSIRYSGHRGNDFGVGSWPGMDAGRDIAAAADGTVIGTNDGEYDRCSSGACSGGSGYGNYVAIRHDDGSTTYYGHMKKWSVAVSYGDRVSCGQKLGEVGSSGYSTGPHLHFEPRRNTSYSPFDPFRGACGSSSSAWISQGSHGGRPGISCGPDDHDGDGYDETRDCDDHDARRHPGATEICDNGVDEDCDGADRASSHGFEDADGDGWGAAAVSACGSLPAGTVSVDGDCDDGRSEVNPGADEVCDGLDNNCNDEADEGAPTQLGAERPLLAAQLVDLSAPAALQPGETADVFVVLENVGAQAWRRGDLWLRPASSTEGLSPLHDEASWAAWDVLAALPADVPVGGTGVLSGRVRLSADAEGAVSERFLLTTPGGQTVKCPTGEVGLHVYLRGAEPSPPPALDAGAELPWGCTAAPARPWGLGLLLAPLALWRRRRCGP